MDFIVMETERFCHGAQSASEDAYPHIMVFGNLKENGGGARVFVNNIKEWVKDGFRVELIGYRDAVPIIANEMPESVRFHHLGTNHSLTTLLALWLHICQRKPQIIIGTSHVSNRILCTLARLPGHAVRCWLTVHQDFVHYSTRSPAKKRRKLREVRRYYQHAEGVITVSKGVAVGLVKTVGLPHKKVHTVYNAVLDESVRERAGKPVDHSWFYDVKIPVIISIGRLTEQKDYPTLLRAFAEVRVKQPCRLIILGEGKLRPQLEALAVELGIADDVDMPGFTDNPYAWLAHSQVFVLSSRWEGFGNVVAEALGVGTPVVATDCHSGPAEILANGRYGILVPVGDYGAMARAILATLRGDGPQYDISEASRPFWSTVTARQYLKLFGDLSPLS